MSIGTLFWTVMLIWLIFGLFAYWPASVVGVGSFVPLGGNVLLWVLLALLGWKVFGPMLKS